MSTTHEPFAQTKTSGALTFRFAIGRALHILHLKRAVHSGVLGTLKWIYGDAYRKVIFERIWAKNYWNDAESRSGSGSNLSQTALLREALPDLLERFRIHSIIDLPCGDFHWMKEVRLPPEISYLGGDIVEQVIARNRREFSCENRQFRTLDLLRDPLPKADLILCRDCLVHFSVSDIFAAISNFKLSNAEYLLTTHYSGPRSNRSIHTGQWRPLNLTQPPFYFPSPLYVLNEKCTEAEGRYDDKCLALWRLADLPCADQTRGARPPGYRRR